MWMCMYSHNKPSQKKHFDISLMQFGYTEIKEFQHFRTPQPAPSFDFQALAQAVAETSKQLVKEAKYGEVTSSL